ncbi:hypothetical protein [Catellatospora sp. NPDC049609]|uniref:hypothetical protein n=1 Tax=Catellatospora sp. NPDC049609 TaxID=3155505 RepID=UPI003423AAFE
MKFVLRNGHESPLELVAEQPGVRRSMAPGEELVIEWTWTGFADLTCRPGRLALAVPPGGGLAVADPGPDVHDLWNGVPAPGAEVREFWIHNATGELLDTFWEPWCGDGGIPAGGGPMRVEWTESARGAGLIYDPGLLVVWDCNGSCRAWLPCGEEVFTGGLYLHDHEGEHIPPPAPGRPTPTAQ